MLMGASLYSRIAVCTDFSESSRASFPVAAALARALGAELRPLHLAQLPPAMVAPWPEVGGFLLSGSLYGEIERKLETFVASEPSFQGLPVRPLTVRGDSMEVLGETLAKESIDLLVIASQGLSGLQRLLLGGFAERVVRSVEVPVLVTPAQREGGAAWKMPPTRISAPFDLAESGRGALTAARAWALRFDASVRLHFVVEEKAGLYAYAANMEGTYAEYLERVRAEALRRLNVELESSWGGVKAEATVSLGDAAESILGDAHSFGADLLVATSHTRSTAERLFLGSVTQKLLRKTDLPILVARPSAAG